jgi:hypothetical protein
MMSSIVERSKNCQCPEYVDYYYLAYAARRLKKSGRSKKNASALRAQVSIVKRAGSKYRPPAWPCRQESILRGSSESLQNFLESEWSDVCMSVKCFSVAPVEVDINLTNWSTWANGFARWHEPAFRLEPRLDHDRSFSVESCSNCSGVKIVLCCPIGFAKKFDSV